MSPCTTTPHAYHILGGKSLHLLIQLPRLQYLVTALSYMVRLLCIKVYQNAFLYLPRICPIEMTVHESPQ